MRFLLFLLSCCAVSSQAAILRVGPTIAPGCGFGTLESAAAAAASNADSSNTIRLSNNISYSGVRLSLANGKTLAIEGGFDDCLDAASDPSLPTVLNALAGESMITVNLSGGDGLRLTSIVVQGGSATEGGGILIRSGTVVLENVQVRNNQARFGGGVAVSGGGVLPSRLQIGTSTRRSFIFNNTATPAPSAFGGGVFCTAGGVVTSVGADVSANSAATGGGYYLTGSCNLHFESSATALVRNNTASLNGGGIHAAGAQVTSPGNGRIFIDGNSAAKGAAIFASGGSGVDLRYAWIKGNSSPNADGSLVFASDANTALALRGGPQHLRCENGEFCSQIHAFGSDKTVLEVRSGALVEIERVHLTGFNGSLAPVFVSQAELRLSNSLVSGNQSASAIFQPLNSGSIRLRYSTVVGNTVPAVFENTFSPGGNAQLYASVVFNPGGLLASVGNLINFSNGSCLALVNENLHADGVGRIATSSGLDANFVPTALGSAIDSCTTDALYVPDMLNNPRPYDAPITNTLGPQDVGAFERQPEPPILRDGFE
jgi:predicted outer membrane repeat protein